MTEGKKKTTQQRSPLPREGCVAVVCAVTAALTPWVAVAAVDGK